MGLERADVVVLGLPRGGVPVVFVAVSITDDVPWKAQRFVVVSAV